MKQFIKIIFFTIKIQHKKYICDKNSGHQNRNTCIFEKLKKIHIDAQETVGKIKIN